MVSPNKNTKDKGDKVTKVAEGLGVVLLDKLLGAAKEGFFREVVFLEGEVAVGGATGLGAFVGFGGFCWFGGLVDHIWDVYVREWSGGRVKEMGVMRVKEGWKDE